MKQTIISSMFLSLALLVSAASMHGAQLAQMHSSSSSSKVAPKAQVATAPSWFSNTYNKTYNYVFASRIQQQQKAAEDARTLLSGQKRTAFAEQLVALIGTGPELEIKNLAKRIDIDALLACKAEYVKTTEQQDDVTFNRAIINAYISSFTPEQQAELKDLRGFINHIAGHIITAATKAHEVVTAQNLSFQPVKIAPAKRNWKVLGVQAGLAATALIAAVFGFKKAGYKLSPHFKIPFFRK